MEGIERSELVLLIFSPEEALRDLRWKHSKEFEYRNNMYDIVEREQKDGNWHFWCWPDKEESKLNKQLISLLDNFFPSDPLQKKSNDSVAQFLKHLIPLHIEDHECLPAVMEFSFGDLNVIHHDVISRPTTPPPDLS